MEEKYIISEKVLKQIEGQLLYYPCSRDDLIVPIEIFAPFIKDFVFVDKVYFNPHFCNNIITRRKFIEKQIKPVLYGKKQYKLIEQQIDGPIYASEEWRIDEKTGERYPYLETCVITEKYKHLKTGEIFRVHRKRGYAVYTLNKYIKKLGVFFYRGDSFNEGGSEIYWLNKKHIREICDKLIDGGLFVTDGSNHRNKKNPYREFWKFHWQIDNFKNLSPYEIIKKYKLFKDTKGRYFECVGYAGMRYGPTMIWQMRKNID